MTLFKGIYIYTLCTFCFDIGQSLDHIQAKPANWVWEQCPSGRRESTIVCPPVAKCYSSDRGNVNKAQKPLPLYWEAIERWSAPGATVAEFTAGSGTLAIACMHRQSLQNRLGT